MLLLKELNKDGATVVMVTHSEENAREAACCADDGWLYPDGEQTMKSSER